MLSLGRRVQLRTKALVRVAFILFVFLLVSAREARAVDWADARAHDKGCEGTNHIFDVRCEHPDGNWSHDCPDMPRRLFRGSAMTTDPVRLPDRAWTRVSISDATCGVDWADARAHDKGCRGTAHIFHVRCERPDGNWSDQCTDMPKRQFRGSAMETDPVRLQDRAWTEVAIADAACRPPDSPTTNLQAILRKREEAQKLLQSILNKYESSPGTSQEKAALPPGGGTAPASTTQAPASPPGAGLASTTQVTASSPESPSSPPQDPTQKRLPGSETALAPAQSPPPACDAEKVTRCKTLLQDQVPWQMSSEPQYRHWQEANLDHLCHCTPDAAQTVQCFQNELYNNNNSWPKAIETCRVH